VQLSFRLVTLSLALIRRPAGYQRRRRQQFPDFHALILFKGRIERAAVLGGDLVHLGALNQLVAFGIEDALADQGGKSLAVGASDAGDGNALDPAKLTSAGAKRVTVMLPAQPTVTIEVSDRAASRE